MIDNNNFFIFFEIFLIISNNIVNSQYFDPNLDDKTYLDMIENDVNGELEQAKHQLIGQAKQIQDVTKEFIGVKLKENLFKALRILSENEENFLKAMEIAEKQKNKNKQPKQGNKQEEDGEGEDDNETKTSTSSSSSTVGGSTTPSIGFVPRVANIIKTLFGGNNRINLTSYVESATKFLPDSVGNQVIGVVKLLAQSPASSASRRSTTLIPTTYIERTTEKIQELQTTLESKISPGSTTIGTNKLGNSTEIDEEEEEEEENSRQLRLPDLSGGLSVLGALLGGTPDSRTSTLKTAVKQTTESASGFEDETTSNSASLANFANDVRNGFGDLIKVVPDLFKGAREGVSLLSALRELFGSFGGE